MKFTGERWVVDDAHGNPTHPTHREHLARYEFAKMYIANKHVLDVACGTGYGSKVLCDGGAAQVVGGDISEEAVTFARSKYAHLSLQVLALDAQALPFQDKSFDVIVSFETLEHLPDYRKYLSEVHRVLTDCGIFIVSTPDKDCYERYNLGVSNPYHVHEFSKAEFVSEISSRFANVDLFGQCPINMAEWQSYERPPVRFKLIKKLLPRNVKDKIKEVLHMEPMVLEIHKNLDTSLTDADPHTDYVFYICVGHKSSQVK